MKKSRKTKKTGAATSAHSGDDKAIWQAVAATVDPLPSPKGRVIKPDAKHVEQQRDVSDGKQPEAQIGGQTRKIQAVPARTGELSSRSQQPQRPGNLEPTKARKIRSGRIEIDGQIDLHGMRQAEAHAALRRFIVSSHQRGHRWLLVITGKGGRARPVGEVSGDMSQWSGTPGVLRQNVPRWLSDTELRRFVIGFQPAAPQHGGDGALYVHIRRPDRV